MHKLLTALSILLLLCTVLSCSSPVSESETGNTCYTVQCYSEKPKLVAFVKEQLPSAGYGVFNEPPGVVIDVVQVDLFGGQLSYLPSGHEGHSIGGFIVNATKVPTGDVCETVHIGFIWDLTNNEGLDQSFYAVASSDC